ncbi:MAG: DUF459 domain-containing protein [Candidatus Shapirobacteria bacterium]
MAIMVLVSMGFVLKIKEAGKQGGMVNSLGQVQPVVSVTVAENQGPTETPVIKKKLSSILILGDSMIVEGFGPRLANDLVVFPNLEVARRGKYSTGLNRRDVFDWYKETVDLVVEHKPEVLVVMFGANDSQNILDKQGNPFGLDEPEWDEVYRERVAEYMGLVSHITEKIYWVGQPAAREVVFSERLRHLNQIYEQEAQKWENIEYISTWERFVGEGGKYRSVVADNEGIVKRVKTDDGIHMTNHGSKIMSRLVVEEIQNDYKLDFN